MFRLRNWQQKHAYAYDNLSGSLNFTQVIRPKNIVESSSFGTAIHLLKSNTSFDNLLSVAIQAGYYDTPHLYREVKRLSGNTPNAFLSLPTNEKVEVLHFEL